jgi:protein-L-isoaspartate(D-aspartate) O-methyltransferase
MAVVDASPLVAETTPAHEASRRAMVANIEQLAAAGALGSPRRLDPRVIAAMREVPRDRFVPEDLRDLAYRDTPLPIGYGSTISQPFIVAVMTDFLEVKPGQKVLEVGTGSGYQAAILARLGARVYTIEIVPQLARSAAKRLPALGFKGVEVRAGDGYKGWPQQAPFDAILVTAGATHIPEPLVRQLKPGGRMLIPMGPDARSQQLTLVTRDARGQTKVQRLGSVMFVPLNERARARPTP